MPFTAAHPAAVWPLARWGLPVPALVIGSIAPDIFMMLPIPEVVHFAHTPPGLVTADLAIGVLAFHAWQGFYGPAVVALTPKDWRPHLNSPWWTVVLAVLIGAVTHLVWDSFTHDWMWGPQHIPWLAERHGRLLGWQWVQQVSDVVGLVVVVAWVAAWWRAAPDAPARARPRYKLIAWLTILGPATLAFCLLLVRDSFYVAITTAAALGVIGLTLVALKLKPR